MSRLSATEGEFSVHEAGGTLYASWRCTDRRVWEQIKLSFRASFPHWSGATYDGGWRAWKVPLHQRHRLAQWADSWFRDEAQHWDEDEPRAKRGQERARHERETAPRSTLDEAYRILWLRPGAPLDVAQAAYKALIKTQHPDHGGDHDAAVAINRAMDLIRARTGAA